VVGGYAIGILDHVVGRRQHGVRCVQELVRALDVAAPRRPRSSDD
jgi:hypothetical protein